MLTIIKKHNGFTLVELVITSSIIAILAAIAAPSFMSIIQNNRMTTQYNELLAHLSLARSEAITRDGTVIICQSEDQASCSGDSDKWHRGWIVKLDDADNTILSVHDALSGNNTLNFDGGSQVAYVGTGLTVADTKRIFTLCGSHNSTRKGLVISTTGRVRHGIASDNVDLTSC